MVWFLLVGIPVLANALSILGTFLVQLVFWVLVFEDDDATHAFDRLLQQTRALGPRKPDGKTAIGWHYMRHRGGWVVAHKNVVYAERASTRTTYTVYCIGGAAHAAICDTLTRNTDKVVTLFEEKLMPWRSLCFSYNDSRILEPYAWQAEAVDDIVAMYAAENRASFFVAGSPGQGKTTLGELVGRRLRKETGKKVLKASVNCAAPGKGVLDYFFMKDPETVLILELNEYDVAIRTATGEIPYENKEVSCYAKDKSELNDLFDFFARQERLVIIASTNDTSLLKDEKYASFVRRFNKVVGY